MYKNFYILELLINNLKTINSLWDLCIWISIGVLCSISFSLGAAFLLLLLWEVLQIIRGLESPSFLWSLVKLSTLIFSMETVLLEAMRIKFSVLLKSFLHRSTLGFTYLWFILETCNFLIRDGIRDKIAALDLLGKNLAEAFFQTQTGGKVKRESYLLWHLVTSGNILFPSRHRFRLARNEEVWRTQENSDFYDIMAAFLMDILHWRKWGSQKTILRFCGYVFISLREILMFL